MARDLRLVRPQGRRGVPIETLNATAPAYPWHLARERVLADGRAVLVRPVHPDDTLHLARFLARHSPETPFSSRVDYDRHMAFVCTAREGGRELIVGDARYVANPGRESCEFGIVVADDWRHTGVAQHLMRALMADAKDKGFRTMASLVLRSNRDMLDFAAQLGFAVEDLPLDVERVRITRTL